jgi:uncharacterized protein YgbK (DUF1537 family)
MPTRLPILSHAQTLVALPAEWPADPLPLIRSRLGESSDVVVVLDDDPTGTQTVHDIPVLTTWGVCELRDEIALGTRLFYILTNSRSLPGPQAAQLGREIGQNLAQAAQQAQRTLRLISRSDSTLRGHFPGEVFALADGLGESFDALVIVPFFLEGGRYTIDDVHYVSDGARLVPAGQTEFALDKAFGYSSSRLPEWVQEKTGGAVLASAVRSITLDDLRKGGPQRVTERLLALPRGAICIANAASMRDVQVLALGVLDAERAGRRILCRTAASYVQARGGMEARPLLTRDGLDLTGGVGGLIVVGSYVQKTSDQLSRLLQLPGVIPIELDVTRLLADPSAQIEAAAMKASESIRTGRDAVIFTSRRLITSDDPAQSLAIGGVVSQALVDVVRGVRERPRYVLAKGGITSSDIATRGLNVRRAMVRGQLLPGVPVWQLGDESRWPGLPCIIFPGNVGGVTSLDDAARLLSAN